MVTAVIKNSNPPSLPPSFLDPFRPPPCPTCPDEKATEKEVSIAVDTAGDPAQEGGDDDFAATQLDPSVTMTQISDTDGTTDEGPSMERVEVTYAHARLDVSHSICMAVAAAAMDHHIFPPQMLFGHH